MSSYVRATELIKVASATRTIGLTPRSKQCISATDCLRQFFDLTYACCFGPRTHGVTIATLRDPANARTWSQAFRLQNQGPIERHHTRLTATLGATAGGWQLIAEATRVMCPGTIPRAPFKADDTEAAPEREVGGINTDAPFFHR